MELKRREVPFDVKTVEDDGSFAGYASVFGVKDSYDEIVAAGAFSESIAEWKAKGKMPPILWQHRSSEPIGVHTVMREDGTGLYIEGKLAIGEVQRAREARALMKLGAISGISIGFITREDSFDRATGIRTLKRVDLWENSIVTFPANPAAQVTAVKRLEELVTLSDCEGFLRDVGGLSRTEAKTFLSRLRTIALRDVEALAAAEKLKALMRG